MSVNIRLKHSAVSGKAPLSSDLEAGELALNTNEATPAAYIKDSAGNVVKLAGAGSVTGDEAVKKNEAASQNMIGDLTLGTDKITLDATDGSAEFAGLVSSSPVSSTTATDPGWYIQTKSTSSGLTTFNTALDTQSNFSIFSSPDPSTQKTGVLALRANGDIATGTNTASGSTKNCLIKASDGSAEFAGSIVTDSFVRAGDNPANGGAVGAAVANNGGIQLSVSTGTQSALRVYTQGDSNECVSILGNGSAEFSGTVTSGTSLFYTGSTSGATVSAAAGDKISLITGTGGRRLEYSSTGNLTLNGYTSGSLSSTPISLNNDGSAEFSGTVTAPNITNTKAALLRLKAALLIPDQDVNQLRARLLEALEIINEDEEQSD